jgi:hypothetical protein
MHRAIECYNNYINCFDIAEMYATDGYADKAEYWYNKANNWYYLYECALGYRSEDDDYY